MTATLTYTPGKFVWRELLTHDIEKAMAFYTGLFGWSWKRMAPRRDIPAYAIATLGEQSVCGLMALAATDDGAGVPPHWGVYVSVEDVDAAAARAIAAGGQPHTPCMDIPGVGRFAVIRDPQGAFFNLFKAAEGDDPDQEPGVGQFCWEHLNTTDPAAAVEFYTRVVGWGATELVGLPFFTREDGTKQVAVVTQVPDGTPPHWLTYVRVADLDATVARAAELGGTVLEPRIDVPGMGAYALLRDPDGAAFMLSQPA